MEQNSPMYIVDVIYNDYGLTRTHTSMKKYSFFLNMEITIKHFIEGKHYLVFFSLQIEQNVSNITNQTKRNKNQTACIMHNKVE